MIRLLHSLFAEDPEAARVIAEEARRVQTDLDTVRQEHRAAIDRANRAIRETFTTTQRYLESEGKGR